VSSAGERAPDHLSVPRLSDSRYDSFVVRILSRAPDGVVVEGHVTHVGSRQSATFHDLAAF
jgi:hypothetical protein